MSMIGKIEIKGSRKKAASTVSKDGKVRHVVWQPGNGSRYFLTFMYIEPDARFAFEGAPNDFILVLYGTPGMKIRAYPFTTDTRQTVAWNYVQQKLTPSKVDASEIARVIGTVLDRPVMLCTRDEDGEYSKERIDHE